MFCFYAERLFHNKERLCLCSPDHQVTLGLFGHEEEVISNPLSPGVIQGIIYSKCCPHGGEREAVLQQELVIHIGWIISNNPELFSGMLKIRVGWVISGLEGEFEPSSALSCLISWDFLPSLLVLTR